MNNSLGIRNFDIDRLNRVLSEIPKNQFHTPILKPGSGKSTAILSTMIGEVENGSGQVYGVFSTHPALIEDLKKKFKNALFYGLQFQYLEHENIVQTKGQTWVFLSFGTYVSDYSFDGVFADVPLPYDLIGNEDREFIDRVLNRVK